MWVCTKFSGFVIFSPLVNKDAAVYAVRFFSLTRNESQTDSASGDFTTNRKKEIFILSLQCLTDIIRQGNLNHSLCVPQPIYNMNIKGSETHCRAEQQDKWLTLWWGRRSINTADISLNYRAVKAIHGCFITVKNLEAVCWFYGIIITTYHFLSFALTALWVFILLSFFPDWHEAPLLFCCSVLQSVGFRVTNHIEGHSVPQVNMYMKCLGITGIKAKNTQLSLCLRASAISWTTVRRSLLKSVI